MPGPLPWRNELFEPLTMRPPGTPNGYRRMRAGTAVAVTEENMLESTGRLAVEAGIWGTPEGGACLAAYEKLIADDWLDDETAVLFNTGSASKYL